MEIRKISVDLDSAPSEQDSFMSIVDCLILTSKLHADLVRDYTPQEAELLAEMTNALSIVRCMKEYGFDYRIGEDGTEDCELFIYQRISDEQDSKRN